MIDLDSIAALLLGHITSGIGRTQHFGDRKQAVLDVDQTDTDPDVKAQLLPCEVEVDHRLTQLVGDLQSCIGSAVLQQHTELVPA